MKTKEQLIEETYKELYKTHRYLVDKDGWFDNSSETHYVTMGQTEFLGECDYKNDTYFRPKELTGIEDNNGWINIYSLEDLPDNEYFQRTDIELDHVWCRRIDGLEYVIPVQNLTYTNHSHWQPIFKYNSPVY